MLRSQQANKKVEPEKNNKKPLRYENQQRKPRKNHT